MFEQFGNKISLIAPSVRRKYLKITKNNHGQALVEFTLIFVLMLIIAWVPADFGLAFYTGQLALNASREGARIAAADPTLPPGGRSCTMPACLSEADGSILKETARRISSALMPGATITVERFDPSGATACDAMVRVQVVGQYTFFFYHLFELIGISVDPITIDRETTMRWEHQC